MIHYCSAYLSELLSYEELLLDELLPPEVLLVDPLPELPEVDRPPSDSSFLFLL